MKFSTFASFDRRSAFRLPKVMARLVFLVFISIALFATQCIKAQTIYVRGGSFGDNLMTTPMSASGGIYTLANVQVPVGTGTGFVFATSDWGDKWANPDVNNNGFSGSVVHNDGYDIKFNPPVTCQYTFVYNSNNSTYSITPQWSTMTQVYAMGNFTATDNGLGGWNPDYPLTVDNNGMGSVTINMTAAPHQMKFATADWSNQWGDGGSTGLSGTAVLYETNTINFTISTAGNYTIQFDFLHRTYTIAPATTMPVTWASFKGIVVSNVIQLDWKTGEESNNQHFEVERSRDGKIFSSLGLVLPNSSHIYSFTDKSPLATNIYRIKQVDYDGRIDYSPIVTIDYKGQKVSAIKSINNPASNTLNVVFNSGMVLPARISIFSMGGILVKSISIGNSENTTIDISALAKGTYILKLDSKSQNESLLFLKY